MKFIYIFFALLLLTPVLAKDVKTYERKGFLVDGVNFSIKMASETSMIVSTDYYTMAVTQRSCGVRDMWRICLQNASKDPLKHYPYLWQVNLSYSKTCDTCNPFGGTCTNSSQCSESCVHNVCRPTLTWCGDGFCDANEVCEADCVNATVNVSAEGGVEEKVLTKDNASALTNSSKNKTVGNLQTIKEQVGTITPKEKKKADALVIGLIVFVLIVVFSFSILKKKRNQGM